MERILIDGVDFTDPITVPEVAKIFRVHPNTIRRWTTRGLLPCIRLPNGRRQYSRPWCEEAYVSSFTGGEDPDEQGVQGSAPGFCAPPDGAAVPGAPAPGLSPASPRPESPAPATGDADPVDDARPPVADRRQDSNPREVATTRRPRFQWAARQRRNADG